MRSMQRSYLMAWLMIVCLAPPPAHAQVQGKFPPDSFINLKVLAQDIPRRQLIDLMRGFTRALGVRCPYCHVGREGMPLDSFDFASDQKRTKRTARIMLRMVRHIDDSILTEIPDRPVPNVAVNCVTCHRGVSRPMPLEDLLQATLDSSGLDSATRAYRGLRQRYYGHASYDFGEATLTRLALALGRNRRVSDAMAFLDLNSEFFPDSTGLAVARGDVYLSAGDTASAVTSYEEALAMDSTSQIARFRLRQLRGARPR
jgi:hypothetical protein